MGNFCATNGGATEAERDNDARIADMIRKDKLRQQKEGAKKLLLLGAGQSGKSTLFKQMKLLYGEKKEMGEDEVESYRSIIVSNIISSMQTLIEYSEKFAQESKGDAFQIKAPTDTKLVKDVDRYSMDSNLGAAIDRLWKDPGIQATYEQRHRFQLIDSAKYYFDKVTEIADSKWKPSTDDVLRSRARTTGIVETHFIIKGSKFSMFDVGGQKSERKKWVKCFTDNIDVLIFVAAISGFNQTLFEDGKTNRMEEAVNLFDKVCREKDLANSSLVLFLNKRDLFEERIKTFDITMAPPLAGFKGDCRDYKQTSKFIEDTFEKIVPVNRSCNVHVTTATDQKNVKVVFESVKQHVLEVSLDIAGLGGGD